MRFDGRVAIVTGSGRGLGRSHALLLARLGAAVVVNDLGVTMSGEPTSEEPALEVVAEIEAAGGRAMADGTDVSSYPDVQRLVDSTLERFGGLDIVVVNHGITGENESITTMTPERFDRQVRVHLNGTFNVVQCAWRHLQASASGRVILTTSNGGLFGAAPHFAAAKIGIVGLTRSLAQEGRADGIAVNAIAPAGFTRLQESRLPEGELKEKLRVITPPEGVSPVVAWLAHDSCDVTGEVFGVIGGRFTRVFIGQTRGYMRFETPEDVRDHHHEAMDEDGYWVPPDVASDVKHWTSTLLGTDVPVSALNLSVPGGREAPRP